MQKIKYIEIRMLKKEDSERGWTFVETLIVIGIVLILTSTVGFLGFRYFDKAKAATAKNQIETFSLALNSYFFDCSSFPTEEQGLEALWQKPILEPIPKNWDGPYVTKKIPEDPWGNEYLYTVPGPGGLPFGLRSLGSDGLEGGEGMAKDITSWEN